ncbi:UNVERIFIED_CONTAM: Retrovirus-related Pol polyprotein from transposon RE1 [Sesamum calycinum]|uniref:Retrovirus-related Pol polyprotein from transposon RE1 n=1 Tax=Sesamum calycinum TaxID=2727403 RepID=A0AAW2N380_9LAMI
MKLKADGSVERYKACLVAKGFNHVEGIYYTESFCPVAKVITVKIFLALAASYAWLIQQLDINNAFLHGYLDEDLYMLPLKGDDVKPGLVCILERSLYGLKQESRQWNLEFTIKLEAYGFVQSVDDYCLLTMITDLGRMFLLVYVDNILITGPSLSEIQKVSYILKDLGVDIVTPIPVCCDNKAALHIMANPVFHERTKHIEIDCHIVPDAYKEGFILPSHIKGTNQIADTFAKALPFKSFATMVSKLGLVSHVPSPTCGGAIEHLSVDAISPHEEGDSPISAITTVEAGTLIQFVLFDLG